MDGAIYLAASGAKQRMLMQQIDANNLANVSTTGFKADLSQARAMPIYGESLPSRVFSMTERPASDFSSGAIQQTGRPLDVAISGKGFFSVQGPDGREGYTRDGNLKISAEGFLTNGAGHLVLGNSGPITLPPAKNVEIGDDGSISFVPFESENGTSITLDRLKLVDPDISNLTKTEDGLFRAIDGSTFDASATVKVISGGLESSNVNAVSSMINMISSARDFEVLVKMIEKAEQNDKEAAKLLLFS